MTISERSTAFFTYTNKKALLKYKYLPHIKRNSGTSS